MAPLDHGRMVGPSAMAIGPHVPRVIRRLEETKRLGGGGIAEDFWMEGRIDPIQAAGHHAPAALLPVVIAIIPRHGGGAEDAQDADNRKPDDGALSNHGHFLRFFRRDGPQLNAAGAARLSRGRVPAAGRHAGGSFRNWREACGNLRELAAAFLSLKNVL
jgi:hypothetical protein